MQELKLEEILKNTEKLEEKKVWYISIIWRPNTWKSTFINTLIWKKISITSNIPQTTRKKILAIYNDEESQIVFFDTPWIHESNKLFNQNINNEAIKSLNQSSLVLYFIDSSREWWEEEKYIKNILSKLKVPIIKVYTKIDLQAKINIPQNENIVKISSQTKQWFDELLVKIKSFLKKEVIPYPKDYYTKQDMYFRISEIIREKIFLHTREEVPHDIFVEVDEIVEKEDILEILAYIYTQSDSQKTIIIWKSWSKLSQIWKKSRLDLQEIFDKKVFLKLRVKTKENWKKDEKLLKNMFK